MRKVTSILAVAAVALAMGACTQQKGGTTPDEPTSGSTYVGLRVSTVKPRAIDKDNPGRDVESKISTMDFISTAGNKNFTAATPLPSPLTTDVASFWQTADGASYIASPWKTSAGSQKFGLILNKGAIDTAIPGEDEILTLDATKTIQGLSADNNFAMTSEVVTKEIKDGITKEAIVKETEINEKSNVFGLSAERIVAQGVVVDATENKNVKDQGTLSDLKFGGAMGAAKTYVYRNHAGDRTMGEDNWYDNYESAVNGVSIVKYTAATGKPSLENGKWTSPYLQQNEAALKNFQLAELTDLTLFTKADIANGNLEEKFSKAGFYFLENSMAKIPEEQHLDWAFTRSAYAKVYGTFKPAHVYKMVKTFVAETGTGKFYDKDTMDAKNQADGGVEGKIVYVETEVKNFTAGTTFYRGEIDKKFYVSSADAKLSNTAKDQKSYKYTDGTVTYRIPWNWIKNAAGDKTLNGNTRRNNIYVINLTGFKELGLNYDPADPNDPNNPADDNPDEPTTPPDGGDPSFDKAATYMNVKVEVLQWNVISRDHTADAM